MASNLKMETTVLYETFEVWNIKVVLFFLFEAILAKFWPFFLFLGQKPKNGQKWFKMDKNEKNKTTFIVHTGYNITKVNMFNKWSLIDPWYAIITRGILEHSLSTYLLNFVQKLFQLTEKLFFTNLFW